MDEFQHQPPSEEPTEAARPGVGRLLVGWVRSTLETVVPAVLIALLINLFLAQATQVYGQSMEPSLHSRQRLVIEKITYRFHGPHRGDIVVLRLPEHSSELLIKRVIGLPGDTVEIEGGRVYVDGRALDEPYLDQVTRGEMAPTTVPPLKVFVLGDNRNFSNDSRSFGMVPIENIVGRAWLSYWPLEDFGLLR